MLSEKRAVLAVGDLTLDFDAMNAARPIPARAPYIYPGHSFDGERGTRVQGCCLCCV